MHPLRYDDPVLAGIAAGPAVGVVSGARIVGSVLASAAIALGLLVRALFVPGPVASPGDIGEAIDAVE